MAIATIEGTIQFFDSMNNVGDALRTVVGMCNKFNRFDVYIGVDSDGNAIGAGLSEEDVRTVEEAMSRRINHPPKAVVSLETDGSGRRYIRITGTGYETPYAFDGWFYIRRCVYSKDSAEEHARQQWTETLTCSMKRH